jgi:hypothetical protein
MSDGEHEFTVLNMISQVTVELLRKIFRSAINISGMELAMRLSDNR